MASEEERPVATAEQVRAHADVAAKAAFLVAAGKANPGHAIQLLIDHVAELRRGTVPGWGPVTVCLADVEPEELLLPLTFASNCYCLPLLYPLT